MLMKQHTKDDKLSKRKHLHYPVCQQPMTQQKYATDSMSRHVDTAIRSELSLARLKTGFDFSLLWLPDFTGNWSKLKAC